MKRFLFLVCVVVVMPFSGCSESVQKSADRSQAESQSNTDAEATDDVVEKTMTSDPGSAAAVVFGDQFPEVLAVDAAVQSGKSWRFNVTLSSTYDSPERYADAWRVLDSEDNELGIRILGHDHASEQPFTRSGKIELPEGTSVVFVEGRDQANGWSGQRFKFELPGS